MTIGRASECEIVLRDAKHTVSRQHARLFAEDDKYVIEDLGSTNGTRINGKRIERARRQSDWRKVIANLANAEDVGRKIR